MKTKTMKNTLLQIILATVVATTATTTLAEFATQEAADAHFAEIRRLSEARWEAFRKDPANDEALKDVIRIYYIDPFDGFSSSMLVEIMQNRVKMADTERDGIPLEREVKIMEEMVREGLTALKDRKDGRAYDDVRYCMIMLGAVPDYDILSLLYESFLSESEVLRLNALIDYIETKEAASIPFLHEAIVKADLTEKSRSNVYWHLERLIGSINHKARYSGENKTNDVAKITTFLTEIKQAEQPKD